MEEESEEKEEDLGLSPSLFLNLLCLSLARSPHESFTLLLSLVLSQSSLEIFASKYRVEVEVMDKREERRQRKGSRRDKGRQWRRTFHSLFFSRREEFVVRTEAAGTSQRTEHQTGIRTREGMKEG